MDFLLLKTMNIYKNFCTKTEEKCKSRKTKKKNAEWINNIVVEPYGIEERALESECLNSNPSFSLINCASLNFNLSSLYLGFL